jgi:hypothetical protein
MTTVDRRGGAGADNPTTSAIGEVSDDAIARLEQDLLGRSNFIHNLADIIAGLPPGATLRVGVYGSWGSGKTSVMKILASSLTTRACHPVWVLSWVVSSRSEFERDLIARIAESLGLHTPNLWMAQRATTLIKSAPEVVAELNKPASMASQLAADLGGSNVARWWEKTATASFWRSVVKKLKGRKLVVFVDDLDRVRPDLLPDVLLTIREALAQPNVIYVVGLAPEIVRLSLAKMNKLWGSAQAFLEKIVELPFYLPQPTRSDLERYTSGIADNLGELVRKDILLELLPILPENPRRLKLWLRFIASLHRIVVRFDPNELNFHALYAAQFLAFEFPENVRRLASDEEALSQLGWGNLSREEEDERSALQKSPIAKHAPKAPGRARRFWTLIEQLSRHARVLSGRLTLGELLKLHERTPEITWREMETLQNTFKEEGAEALSQYLRNAGGNFNQERAAALFAILVEARGALLGAAAEATYWETDGRSRLTEAGDVATLLRSLTGDLGLFREGVLARQQWRLFLEQAAQWAQFTGLEEYEPARRDEQELLRSIVADLPTIERLHVYEALRYDHFPRRDDRSFAELLTELKNDTERTTLEWVLSRFTEPEGVSVFWTDRAPAGPKGILFDPDSRLYSDIHFFKQLIAIADRAVEDPAVQLNFLTFLRMVCYGGREGGTFPKRECTEIARNRALIPRVWQAATLRTLNPRTAGDLRRDRQWLTSIGQSDSDVPLPAWWLRLEEIGFFRDRS